MCRRTLLATVLIGLVGFMFTATVLAQDSKPVRLAGKLIKIDGKLLTVASEPPRECAATSERIPNPPGSFLISGTITAIAADSISVKHRDQTTTITTNDRTVFRLEGKVVAAADLKPGLAVGIWGTAGKPAVEVRAFTPKAK